MDAGLEDVEVRSVRPLPPRYGVTALYTELRICERFGLAPFGKANPATWTRSEEAAVWAYQSVRQREEAKE